MPEKLEGRWIQSFRAGEYPGHGKFTPADIQHLAAVYDPNFEEAPVTVDHAQEGPARGWVEAVRANGDILETKFRQVDPAFEADVVAGRYKRRSVELYREYHGKGLYLGAVSFLGAKAPAVKGLSSIFQVFRGRKKVFIEFQEAEVNQPNREEIRGIAREAFTEFFAGLFGAKAAPQGGAAFAADRLDTLVSQAAQPLKEKMEALSAKLAESARASALGGDSGKSRFFMAEIRMPAQLSAGMRVANLELAQRVEGIQLEAMKHGARLSWPEAKQIALAEGFKQE